MKKASLLFCFILAGGIVSAQDAGDNKTIMNYNGHWYVPGDNALDKEALHYQQLIKEKSAFDTLAKSLDYVVSRDQYDRVAKDLDLLYKDETLKYNNATLVTPLSDYVELTKMVRTNVVGNDNYRRQFALISSRVIKARREGWSDDLYMYVLRESIIGTLNFLTEMSRNDAALKLALAEIKMDQRYQDCNYNIVADAKMMDDPDMQMFICDRMEYILGADIYRYRETMPGVIKNYDKRKKESAELMGWLIQRSTQDRVKFIVPVSFSHNMADKKNEEHLMLNKNTEWYVFLFYKGLLYYSDALPKCDNKTDVTIMYKQ
ncbi:MAG: hypothetical protein JST82_09205 [Bacteroidetes bacterium]|nr:hypothetical protein [Bacteroidota bacterium]